MQLSTSELRDLNTHLVHQINALLMAHKKLVGSEHMASGLIATMGVAQIILLVMAGVHMMSDADVKAACDETGDFLFEYVLNNLRAAQSMET